MALVHPFIALVVLILAIWLAIKLAGIVVSLIWTAVVGVIIGGIASELVAGGKKLTTTATVLYGVGGSFLGKAIGGLLGAGWLFTIILSIAAAAGLIVLVNKR